MADAHTPAWLQETPSDPEPTSGPKVVAPPPPPAPAPAGSSGMSDRDITADDADLPGVILTMRLANMGAAVALIVCAVSKFIFVKHSLRYVIFNNRIIPSYTVNSISMQSTRYSSCWIVPILPGRFCQFMRAVVEY